MNSTPAAELPLSRDDRDDGHGFTRVRSSLLTRAGRELRGAAGTR